MASLSSQGWGNLILKSWLKRLVQKEVCSTIAGWGCFCGASWSDKEIETSPAFFWWTAYFLEPRGSSLLCLGSSSGELKSMQIFSLLAWHLVVGPILSASVPGFFWCLLPWSEDVFSISVSYAALSCSALLTCLRVLLLACLTQSMLVTGLFFVCLVIIDLVLKDS